MKIAQWIFWDLQNPSTLIDNEKINFDRNFFKNSEFFYPPTTKRQKSKKICIVCENKFYPSLLYRHAKINFGPRIFKIFRNCFLSPQLVGIENVLLFGFLLKVFYSLTNQLGKNRRKIRNYFLSPQLVGIEKCQN